LTHKRRESLHIKMRSFDTVHLSELRRSITNHGRYCWWRSGISLHSACNGWQITHNSHACHFIRFGHVPRALWYLAQVNDDPITRKRDKKKEKAKLEALAAKKKKIAEGVIVAGPKRGNGRRKRVRLEKAKKRLDEARKREKGP
jgi:hypothetical protein